MHLFNVLTLCVTYSYCFSLGSSTPVAQEGKFPPTSESNVRKAYLSRQFEDHTKNFILRAQERFELQAEKRKQQAKTKKAYSSINQLPVSSSDSNSRSVSQSIQWMTRLPIPFWFLASPQMNQFDDNESGLTRLKRQIDASTAPSSSSSSSSSSTMNLDSVLAFVKEQTAKLEQVNRQLKSLTGSVSQGLDKLRSSGLGSLGSGSSSSSSGSSLANAFGLGSSSSGSSSGDSASTGMGSIMQSLQAQAAQASQGITKAMGSFNPSSTSTSTGSTDSTASPSVESLQQTASNTLSQIQNAFASVANRMPSSNSGSTGGSSSSAGDVLTSIFQG